MCLKDRKIIITGGPTREWLDPVRFLSNPSTGKMGVALADAAAGLCRETVFIHGPVEKSLLQDKKYRIKKVETTDEMLNAVMEEIEDQAVIIMAAAPADYTPLTRMPDKIKKGPGDMNLALARTPDILKNISLKRDTEGFSDLFVVGFAAETGNAVQYALDKLKKKNLDMICLNDVSKKGAGFGTDTNIITVFLKNGISMKLPILSKAGVAVRILKIIHEELDGGEAA